MVRSKQINAVIVRIFEGIRKRPLVVPAILAVIFMYAYVSFSSAPVYDGSICCNALVRQVDYKLDGSAVFTLRTSEYGRILYNGTCEDSIEPGDHVFIEGKLKHIKPPTNPGEFDYSLYLKRKGITGVLYPERIIITDKGSWAAGLASRAAKFFYEVRKYAVSVFAEEDRGLAAALFMGDASLVDDEVTRQFRLSNCSHLLAVSGTHFGGFLMILSEIFSRFHVKKKRAGPVFIAFCLLVGMFTGWSESVTRACVMSILSFLARDYASGMSLAVILIAVRDPYSLLSTGFLMSFSASLAIRLSGERIKALLVKLRVPEKAAGLLAPVFAATLGMMPFWGRTCFYFSALHLIVQIIASALAFTACVFFIPSVITGLPFACSFIFRCLSLLMRVTSSQALRSGSSQGLSPLFIYSLFALVCLLIMPGSVIRKHLLIPAAVMVTVSLGFMAGDYLTRPEVTVMFIDVGQGDCCLIMSGGKSMLIDGGVEAEGKYAVSSVLDYYGIGEVDLAVGTHMDEDHIGGLNYLNESGRIGMLLTCYDLKAGDEIMITDDVILTCVWPHQVTDGGNEDSVVLRLQYEGFSILFTGDIGFESEAALIQEGAFIDSDILKVGHHGSAYSTSTAFLEAVSPEEAVISVVENSPYGHPAPTTLERLTDYGCIIRRTDLEGPVLYELD